MVRWLLIAALFAAAGFMPAAALSVDTTSLPPTRGAMTLAALGRERAAGVVSWMLTVQRTGRDAYIKAGYPGLEHWLALVFELEPDLTNAYYLGTILLLADSDRSSAMDAILAQAEERHPDEWEFSMMRGSAAYFGRLDAPTASKHFLDASRKPGAPEYLGLLGARLERMAGDCGTMLSDLKALGSENDPGQLLRGQRATIYRECIRRELEQAHANFRLNHQRAPTLDELVASGVLKAPPPHPPGECWEFRGPRAVLAPCPRTEP